MKTALIIQSILWCLMMMEPGQSFQFAVENQGQCKQCVDAELIYFSGPTRLFGQCCTEDEDQFECAKDGRTTQNRKDLLYFLCPQDRSCGPSVIQAKKAIQQYSMHTKALELTSSICSHQMKFSIEAGRNDIMQVRFTQLSNSTRVAFAVGTSYETAIQGLIQSYDDAVLSVSFPNQIFMTIEHQIDPPEPFTFEFGYTDNNAFDREKEFQNGYQVDVKPKEIKEKQSVNILYIFIGGCALVTIVLCTIVLICVRVKNEHDTTVEATNQRRKGVAQWGVKTQFVFIDEDGNRIERNHPNSKNQNQNASQVSLDNRNNNTAINNNSAIYPDNANASQQDLHHQNTNELGQTLSKRKHSLRRSMDTDNNSVFDISIPKLSNYARESNKRHSLKNNVPQSRPKFEIGD